MTTPPGWLGFRPPALLPAISPSAQAVVASALSLSESARHAGTVPHPQAHTAHIWEYRCQMCHTPYGYVRVFGPLGAGVSAQIDLCCRRSHCRHLTVLYVSDAGVSAGVSAYEGGPSLSSLNGQAGRVRMLSRAAR